MLLDYIRKNDIKKQPIILCGDSKLVVEQMNGNWSMNKGIYIPYAKKLMEALIGYPNILFRWISRDYNNIADELSKSQMKARGVKFKIQPQ
jgi:ribonuclease HI